jgi:hypothetical protein
LSFFGWRPPLIFQFLVVWAFPMVKPS